MPTELCRHEEAGDCPACDAEQRQYDRMREMTAPTTPLIERLVDAVIAAIDLPGLEPDLRRRIIPALTAVLAGEERPTVTYTDSYFGPATAPDDDGD